MVGEKGDGWKKVRMSARPIRNNELKYIQPDAVLITSFGRQEEIHQNLQKLIGNQVIIKKLSDL